MKNINENKKNNRKKMLIILTAVGLVCLVFCWLSYSVYGEINIIKSIRSQFMRSVVVPIGGATIAFGGIAYSVWKSNSINVNKLRNEIRFSLDKEQKLVIRKLTSDLIDFYYKKNMFFAEKEGENELNRVKSIIIPYCGSDANTVFLEFIELISIYNQYKLSEGMIKKEYERIIVKDSPLSPDNIMTIKYYSLFSILISIVNYESTERIVYPFVFLNSRFVKNPLLHGINKHIEEIIRELKISDIYLSDTQEKAE